MQPVRIYYQYEISDRIGIKYRITLCSVDIDIDIGIDIIFR